MSEDFIIKLKISPNSSKNEIIKSDEEIKIKLTAQPIENKANIALIKFLSENFKIPKTHIEIIKGTTSKEKTLLFKNLSCDKIMELKKLLN